MGNFKPVKPDEKVVVSMRIKSSLLKMIDEKSVQLDISRNELINQMILYAITNMDADEENGN